MCVNVIVQAVLPVPVVVVLEVLPVNVLLVVPDDTALPRMVLMLVISVLILASTWIKLPVTGAVLEVIVVPV